MGEEEPAPGPGMDAKLPQSEPSSSTPHGAATSMPIASTSVLSHMLPRKLARRTRLTTIPVTPASMPSDPKPAEDGRAVFSVTPTPTPTREDMERDEALLYVVECAVSDYGLAVYHSGDLLPAFRDSPGGFIHLQRLLKLPLVRALTHSQADLQRALRSRTSIHFTLSDDGWSLRRTRSSDYSRIEAMTKSDWTPSMLYLESIPVAPGTATPSSLSRLLSDIFKSPIQRVSLPASSPSIGPGQDQELAFKASNAPTFPTGGGPYRGFAFVVVENEDLAREIVQKWNWDKDFSSGGRKPSVAKEHEGNVDEEEDEDDKGDDDGDDDDDEEEEDDDDEGDDDRALTQVNKVVQQDLEHKARASGLRALPLTRYYQLQEEYLAYRQTILRASRAKPAPAPKAPARPDIGAYPVGCILWIRNTHPGASRLVMLTLFRKLLEGLEEGSGKGVEFVDVEKGVDQCHVRFASARLASVVLQHLNSHRTLHVAPSKLVPFDDDSGQQLSSSPRPRPPSGDVPTRPLIATLLTGPREKLYWANLPEGARRAARSAAKGVGDLERAPAKNEDGERHRLEATVKREEKETGSEDGPAGKRSVWDKPAELLQEERKIKRPNRG